MYYITNSSQGLVNYKIVDTIYIIYKYITYIQLRNGLAIIEISLLISHPLITPQFSYIKYLRPKQF